MALKWNMPSTLRPYYEAELVASRRLEQVRDHRASWRHLERAHILGQQWPQPHTSVHWKMLLFGVRLKNWREILGQLPRLLTGGVKSFVGHIPVGNTGGADVPPLRPMEIPEDLQLILARHGGKQDGWITE